MKTALHAKHAAGERMVTCAPLGYMKDPNRRNHLIVDPETKWIIEKIFDMALHAAPRLTARAILRGPDGRFAVTHTEGFGIHMLPGGGVDAGESVLAALHREVFEETGCRIATAVPLGYVEENRGHADYTQLSHYFICTTEDATLSPHPTEAEIAHGATAAWMSCEEMLEAIGSPVFDRPQGKFLQARDMAALTAWLASKSPD